MKKMFLLILSLVVNLSCRPASNMELINNPDVLKGFNKEEASSLELIVNFFDSFILESTEKAQNINQAYYQYFETIKSTESIEDVGIKIGLSNSACTKALIKNLKKSGVFQEIWKYSYSSDFKTKDTLSVRLALNQQGRYMQLLKLLGEDNHFFFEYYQDLKMSGGISPGNIAQFIKYFPKVKFQKEVNRLVFAVHYITIVSGEKYKNK